MDTTMTEPTSSTPQTSCPLTRPLSGGPASLAEAGGKAASLTRLLAAGLPVPPGFLATTEAYQLFVRTHGLDQAIERALSAYDPAAPDPWAGVSAAIHDLFLGAPVPPVVAAEVGAAYAALGAEVCQAGASEAPGAPTSVAVAVRSSATAEDLPTASFAGQQETFLNVVGEAQVLDAVRRCWASLWTSRALAYRERLGIDQRAVAMAVVVQELTPADVAGVLFTANPASGARDELLVNASYGLGETIVSGQVTPDTFVLSKGDLAVRSSILGGKELSIVADTTAGHGVRQAAVPEAQREGPALAPGQLRELGALGVEVERLNGGVPQDIEWALTAGRFWLLQARPITGLPPVPLTDVRWEPPIPGSRWIRRQVVEHMPEPLSPLFEELYLHQGLDASVRLIYAALDVPDRMHEIVDHPLFSTVNGFAYQRADIKLSWGTAGAFVSIVRRSLPALFARSQAHWEEGELPRYRTTVARWKALDPATLPDRQLLEGIRELAYADARYWFAAALVIGTAKVTDGLLDWYLRTALPRRRLSSGPFLRAMSARGLAAERALEQIAALARRSAALCTLIQRTPPERVRAALAAHPDGQHVVDALDDYLDEFGHLIYSLDFAVPTQADDPSPALLSLRALVGQPPRDADARLARLARERDALTRQTDRTLDPFRRRFFRTFLRWARRYAPNREEALFSVGLGWPTLRRLALELGRRLVGRGGLAAPDDVFYLTSAEIEAACSDLAAHDDAAQGDVAHGDVAHGDVAHGDVAHGDVAHGDPPSGDDAGVVAGLAALARERRQLREARKRLHPPAAVPPTYTFKLGPIDLSSRESQRRNTADTDTLSGFPVSPGQVTAPASVILSPAEFGQMQPGSVLVCPTTTPAWTPLFSQARALVTDIGGILAHGSIVAREYGIPAVMGTGIATQRIKSGQVITVDGTGGTVSLAGRLSA
jgi:rifampicin phosphotransferase